MEDGTRAGWPGGQERLRALRYRCEYPRTVRGLVLRRLLRCRGRTQSAGTSQWIAPSLARRILAALHEGLALCRPFEHPSRISVRRLWLPRRPRCVDDCQPEPSGGAIERRRCPERGGVPRGSSAFRPKTTTSNSSPRMSESHSSFRHTTRRRAVARFTLRAMLRAVEGGEADGGKTLGIRLRPVLDPLDCRDSHVCRRAGRFG